MTITAGVDTPVHPARYGRGEMYARRPSCQTADHQRSPQRPVRSSG
jgi:hypothetical protein